MVLPKNKTDEYLEKASHLSSSVPLYSQLILSEIISSGSFERHLNFL
jgi:DNA-binding transcriptional MocR family regulator